MTAPSSTREAELDRLCELANVGAGWAATALAQLLGRTVKTSVPVLRAEGEPGEPGPWRTGLVFEIEGPLAGILALFLTPASADASIRRLLGGDGEPREDMAESALRELGNIVASQTVSAIANTTGSRLMLSLPMLIEDRADDALDDLVGARQGERRAPRIECVLSDSHGGIRVLLVFALDALAGGRLESRPPRSEPAS